ncbi:MAG: DUF4932 domain-containing protein, partial [Candidatus Cloacimonetes bacterium]|nr:DUF4932 domain-containing protein [Candidatus Cloacimonadota bacterium]
MHKFILLVTLWLSIPGCQFLSAEPGSFYTENKGGIMFQVDPRIELLAVVQYLSGSNLVCSDETGYSMAIDQWFAGHREHPLIPLWQKLEKRGFTYDAPVAYFLQFESIAFRDKQNKFPSYYGRILTDRMEKVIRKQAEERELLESLRDFASQSRFEEFMSSQADYYQEQIKATAALLPDKDISGTITTWFGSAQNSFNFIVTPLYVTNGYGPCLQNAEGGLDLYCISAGQTDGLSLLTLLVHEFSHSYINPLVEEHYQRLKKARKLYKPIRKQMVAQAYTDWWVTLVEHYVRAATIRIYARLMDQSEVSAKLSG